jgi:hypothetical protein
MIKILATFLVDEDRLEKTYRDLGIEGFSDSLNAEFGVMEENGVSLDDWKKVDIGYQLRDYDAILKNMRSAD